MDRRIWRPRRRWLCRICASSEKVSRIRAGKIPTIRCSTPMADSRNLRSRSAKFRATCMPPKSMRRESRPGRGEFAANLRCRRRLCRNFEAAFWCDELGTYALALDGDKKPCLVRSSNSGHALFTGIAAPERAKRVAQTLMAPASFTGWGIRTVASGESRYNPISYHNGSIWPHDNAMIALGFARYGLAGAAAQLFSAMFAAAVHQDLRRLPDYSAASRGGHTAARPPTRSPARRRRGRRRRLSPFCKPASAWSFAIGTIRFASSIRSCRLFSNGSPSPRFASANRG